MQIFFYVPGAGILQIVNAGVSYRYKALIRFPPATYVVPNREIGNVSIVESLSPMLFLKVLIATRKRLGAQFPKHQF